MLARDIVQVWNVQRHSCIWVGHHDLGPPHWFVSHWLSFCENQQSDSGSQNMRWGHAHGLQIWESQTVKTGSKGVKQDEADEMDDSVSACKFDTWKQSRLHPSLAATITRPQPNTVNRCLHWLPGFPLWWRCVKTLPRPLLSSVRLVFTSLCNPNTPPGSVPVNLHRWQAHVIQLAGDGGGGDTRSPTKHKSSTLPSIKDTCQKQEPPVKEKRCPCLVTIEDLGHFKAFGQVQWRRARPAFKRTAQAVARRAGRWGERPRGS